MKKRIISLLLAVVMVLGLVPMTVLAEEACTHANVSEAAADAGNGLHTTTRICDDCGETVAQDTISIDFFEFVEEAAQQPFWENLKTVQTYGEKNVKVVNWTYGGEQSEAEQQARLELIDWMAARDWRIDLDNQDNRFYFSDDETLRWAVGHNAFFYNMENRSDMKVTFRAESAGVYDISIDVVKQSSSAGNTPVDTDVDVGCGYGDIYVNGQLVKEHYCFAPDKVDGAYVAHEQNDTITLGEVMLQEGENTIAIRTTANINDVDNYGGRCWQFVNAINMVQRGAAEACEDQTGDGKCDTCGAVIGECLHPEHTVVYAADPENPGAHIGTFRCALCGEENIAVTQKIDFIDDLAAAVEANAEAWAALPKFPLLNGKGEVGRIGVTYGGTHPEGSLEGFRTINAWLAENKGWSLDEEQSRFTSTSSEMKVFFNTDHEAALWGMNFSGYYTNFTLEDGRSSFAIAFDAPDAGLYDLTVDFSMCTTSDTDTAGNDALANAGNSTIDIYVNGNLAAAGVSLQGTGILSQTLEDLQLRKGENNVLFHIVADPWGSTVATSRNNVNVAGMSLTQYRIAGSCDDTAEITYTANGDETHTASGACAACGTAFTPAEEDLNVIKVDFVDFAQQAAKQDFWANIPDEVTVNGKAIKRIGVNYHGTEEIMMPESERQAYADLIAWQQENLDWSFNEDLMEICDENGNMIFLANDVMDSKLKWGVAHHSYFYDMKERDNRSNLALTVVADEAGYYQLDMTYAPESSTAETHPAYGYISAGGGYVDIYVNGELVVSNFCMQCPNYTEHEDYAAELATVYLQAGENDIIIYQLANYHGYPTAGYSGRGNTNIADLTFTEVQTTLADEAVTIALADVIGAQATATAGALTVVSSDENVATAAFADGNIVITPVADGQAVISLTGTGVDGTALTAGKVLVNVGNEVIDACVDADGDRVCDLCGGELSCKHVYSVTQKIEAAEGEVHAVYSSCDLCDAVIVEAEMYPCQDTDEEFDGICNFCGEEVSCAHDKQVTVYEDNEDGTHEKRVGCERCGEFILNTTEECFDEDEDGKCVCGAEMTVAPPACDHSNTSSETVANADKTHTTTVTCECGEVVSTETVACADADKDTKCDVCGATIKEISKITLVGANMTLGNDLKMNFMIKKSDMKEGYVAYVKQGDLEPARLELWSYNASYYAASYSVAAKEMTDILSCEIYDAEGYLVSNPFTRTVAQYAMTLLNNPSQKAALKSVIVDMLNYGTEAQKYFHYNEDAYANAEVTADQQTTYATGDVECNNVQDKILNCAGSNLSLEDSILLNVFFSGVSGKDITTLSATIEFVDYKGNPVTATVGAEKYGSSMAKVVVNQVVLADAKRPVNVKLFDANGTKIGEAIESVESYIARNLTNESTGAINMAIIKFATSAYNYLGGTN